MRTRAEAVVRPRMGAVARTGMCELIGLPRPSQEHCFALGVSAERFIVPRLRVAIADLVEAIRVLDAKSYALHTASGASSVLLAGYLETLGAHTLLVGNQVDPGHVRQIGSRVDLPSSMHDIGDP